ncbi:MAG: hypothetical protein WA435_09325 [Gallionellaceae bacterium]
MLLTMKNVLKYQFNLACMHLVPSDASRSDTDAQYSYLYYAEDFKQSPCLQNYPKQSSCYEAKNSQQITGSENGIFLSFTTDH